MMGRMLPAVAAFVLGGAAVAAAMWAWQRLEDLPDPRAWFRDTPEIEAHFNVFWKDGGLTYVREPCVAADLEGNFFLHVTPLDVRVLSADRKGYAFDNLDFEVTPDLGGLVDGVCEITVDLPEYAIDAVDTGQYDETGKLWAGRFAMPRTGEPVRDDNVAFKPGTRVFLGTHLHELEVTAIGLEPFADTGGAIERVGDQLLVATPRGRLATITDDGTVDYLDGRVHMNEAGFRAVGGEVPNFRVLDILVRERPDGGHELFATHHFFNGRCAVVRLSATTLAVAAGRMEVMPGWRVIFDAEPCLVRPYWGNESGGRMLADGAGHLLVTVGHHGEDAGVGGAPPPSQDPALHLGKVVRVDTQTGQASVYTVGHRNPQGLVRDRHGDVWLTEHGARGGDELNLIEPGGNYGWPEVSYGYPYSRRSLQPVGRLGHHHGFLAPVFAWVPSIGISAIVANDEEAFPLWGDDLIIASLWGRSHGYSLFRARHRERQVAYVERIEIGYQIRDLAHAPDGGLALLLDIARVLLVKRSDRWCGGKGPPGYVHAAHCADGGAAPVAAPPAVAATAPPRPAPLGAEAKRGAALYARHCGSCHHLDAERYGLGAPLLGILGRRAGAASVDAPALAALDTVWDAASLRSFIIDPAGFAPGTTMPSSGVDAAEAAAIVAYIASHDEAAAEAGR